jgi:hypothetical protein
LILQNKTLLTVEKKYIKEEGPTLGKTNNFIIKVSDYLFPLFSVVSVFHILS